MKYNTHETPNSVMTNVLKAAAENNDFEVKDILDYISITSEDNLLTTDNIEFETIVSFGSSEGIYLDCYIDAECNSKDLYCRRKVATFKTLEDNKEAMIRMAAFGGALTYHAYGYFAYNTNKFSYNGADEPSRIKIDNTFVEADKVEDIKL